MSNTLLLYIMISVMPFPFLCVEFFVFTERKSFSNMVGSEKILETKINSNSLTCVRSCHENPQCSSYFENDLTNECRLVSGNVTESDIYEEIGWKYLVKTLRQPSCPTNLGFHFYQDSNICLKMLPKMNRADAENLCESSEGRIMRIKNNQQQADAAAFMGKFYREENVIIDGSRTDPNGSDWTYSNGEPIRYFKWADGIDLMNAGNKLSIKLDKNRNFDWSPSSNQNKFSLCEVPLSYIEV